MAPALSLLLSLLWVACAHARPLESTLLTNSDDVVAPSNLRDAAYAAAVKYMPRWILHPTEDTFPSSVDYFLKNVNLEVGGSVVLQTPSLDELAAYCDTTSCSNGRLVPVEGKDAFELPNKYPSWLGGISPEVEHSPVYIYFDELQGGSRVDVYYWTFYPYNKYPALGGKIVAGSDHIGDWEYDAISFSVDADFNFTPKKTYFSAHSAATHGRAYDYSSQPRSGVRPLAYVAKGSHGTWDTVGKQCYAGTGAACIFAYDTTGAGLEWDPSKFAGRLPTTWCVDAKCERSPVDVFTGRWGVDSDYVKKIGGSPGAPLTQKGGWLDIRDRIAF